SPDGSLVASAEDEGPVRLWDLVPGKAVVRFFKDIKTAGDIAFSPDGKLLAATGEGDVIFLWYVRDGRELGRIKGGRTFVFHPDAKNMIVGGPAGLTFLYDLAAGQEVRRLGFLKSERAMSLSRDGQILASSDGFGRTFNLWKMPVCQPIGSWRG